LAALGVGVLVGLVNGILVGVLRLNPLIVTLAVGQIDLAWSSKYWRDVVTNQPNEQSGLASWARDRQLGVSSGVWTGSAITLASATSTWLAALEVTLLTQMLVIMGLSAAMQYVVFGAAIIAGMVVSGDRVSAVLSRGLRLVTPPRQEATSSG